MPLSSNPLSIAGAAGRAGTVEHSALHRTRTGGIDPMLTRREILVAATAAAALAATPSAALAQTPSERQRGREAVPPTGPDPVSARPPDNLGGSTINVGSNPADLQAAINASAQGDTLVCPAGVTYHRIILPIREGTGWTCIRTNGASLPAAGTRVSPSDASQMFKITSSGRDRAVVIPPGTRGWRFIGMEATHPSATFQWGLIDADGDRTSFERCYIHGQLGQQLVRCLYVRGNDFQMWDSWISEAQYASNDSQAIFTRNNARFHIENCEIQGAGENIMLGDEGSVLSTTDAVLRRNHFFKPLTWRKFLVDGKTPNPTWDGVERVIKNLFEIKAAHRVLFEGNVLENHWRYSQPGDSILINASTNPRVSVNCQDLMYRSNIVKNVPWMMAANTAQAHNQPLARVAFLNNLGLDVGGRFLLLLHRCHDLWIEHNTVVPMRGVNVMDAVKGTAQNSAIFIAWDNPVTDYPRLTIKNNVFGKSNRGIALQAATLTNASLDRWIPDRAWAANAQYDMPGSSPVAGVTYYASDTAAGVSLTTGRLTTGSPFIRAGSDGKDIGVDFVDLDAAHKPAVIP